jgi:hypothetical protein
VAERTLSDREIREMVKDGKERRKKDRRTAINSYVDPKHERRNFNRRISDKSM